MPECQNCGEFVTKQYRRVMTPPGVDEVRCCPDCPDLLRDGSQIREARSTRHGGTDPTGYDPEKDPTVDTDQ